MKRIILLSIMIITGFTYSQSDYRFFINKINMPINNKGVLGAVNVPPDGSLGRYNGIGFLFSGGFLISGYNSDTLWANGQATASLIENHLPGPFGSNQFDPRHKVYVVKKTDPHFGPSWQEWVFAVELGAKFYDGDGDGIYNPVDKNNNGVWDPDEDRPDLIGDELAWSVYNDGVTPRLRFVDAEPVGIEIRQSVFGFRSGTSGVLENMIFIRYEILNTGALYPVLDSVYFAAWADADLGDHVDDLVGADTLSNSGYLYNDSADAAFGNDPPAFFINILQGPVAYIPGETFIDVNANGIYDEGIDTPLDTAYNNNGPLRGIETYPGARNQKLTSFVHYQASDPTLGDPNTMQEARNYMLGQHRQGGYINPCTWILGQVRGGVNCSEVNPLYWYSGDPESNIGWINTRPTDQRMIVNTGHFTLLENEPVTIIIGYTIGHGTDEKNSVTKGKLFSQYASEFYQSNFENTLVSVDDDKLMLPDDFKLFQNYPNPFNPSTKISWQSPVGSWQTIKVFDVLGREVATLVDEYRDAGYYEVEFQSSIGSLQYASGVYYYQLKAGSYIETKKMILLR